MVGCFAATLAAVVRRVNADGIDQQGNRIWRIPVVLSDPSASLRAGAKDLAVVVHTVIPSAARDLR